ncbi:MAG: hypothetical protein SVT52_08125 [Planctomycetota bacterium]|nr:hypothetical protein [Planctomycetota bacterium]
MDEMDILRAELEHYKTEKNKIRDLMGQIGGKTRHRRNMMINTMFLIVVVACFVFDLLRNIFGWHAPYLPPLLLLEIAVLLVSLKIIWMIHTKNKVDHFQFWILNSIEFQMNMISRRINDLEKTVQAAQQKAPAGQTCTGNS